MPTVTLIDGRQVDSASEEWRHECEARQVARLPDQAARHGYVAGVKERRGEAAGRALWALAATIYTAERAARKEKPQEGREHSHAGHHNA